MKQVILLYKFNPYHNRIIKRYDTASEYTTAAGSSLSCAYPKNFAYRDGIDTTIKVDWAKGTNDKYIDLIYDECVIRLDSMNQCVKNLTNGKILFKSDGDRMTNHYINSFKHMLKNKQNFAFSLNLHKELLKAYD